MPSDEAPPPTVIPSQLSTTPDAPLSSLAVQLTPDAAAYAPEHLAAIVAGWRASCYLATAQIFLQSNATVSDKLTKEHIKPRLLGVSAVYAR